MTFLLLHSKNTQKYILKVIVFWIYPFAPKEVAEVFNFWKYTHFSPMFNFSIWEKYNWFVKIWRCLIKSLSINKILHPEIHIPWREKITKTILKYRRFRIAMFIYTQVYFIKMRSINKYLKYRFAQMILYEEWYTRVLLNGTAVFYKRHLRSHKKLRYCAKLLHSSLAVSFQAALLRIPNQILV